MWWRLGIGGALLLLSACSPGADFLSECHQLNTWVAKLPADRQSYWQNLYNTQGTYKGADILGILKESRPDVASTEITRINTLAGETNYNHPETTRICAPPPPATPTRTTAAVAAQAAAPVTAASQANASTSQPVGAQAVAAPLPALSSGQTVSYTVKTGDTLSSIAKQYGTTVDAIVRANNIANKDRINIGQQLSIPGK
ncbi:MAG: LysM peptidoglycan-binding domain-containing protein [Chloroflexi bacterium]|nr:LysM peptidoglycan-binding domain-containing protein [Chloroflexota bacterium]